MDPTAHEWLNIILRWAHAIAAIMWIGDSFLFMWLDSHLTTPEKPREGAVVGELWMVHSGGFYEVVKRKYLAPNELPKQLHWFKWESYTTWVTGFFLLGVVYYGSHGVYLVDSNTSKLSGHGAIAISLGVLVFGWLIYDTLWQSPLKKQPKALGVFCYGLVVAIAYGLTHIFGGRAAFIHVGAMLATIMAWNVFFRIIPAQKYMLAQTKAGQPVDTTLGLRAKQRSVHNHYMTLPVLFTMLSNHFPSTWGHPRNWLVLAAMLIVGAGLKYIMNFRLDTHPAILGVTATALGIVVVMSIANGTATVSKPVFADAAPVPFARAQAILAARCMTCHSATPSNPSFPQPPNGIAFDDPRTIHSLADRILIRAVVTKTMPLGNLTGMTEDERNTVGAWVVQGAKLEGVASTSTGSLVAAKEIFESRCVMCHGLNGRGDGAAAAAMNPKPRNYTDHAWQASVTDDGLRKIILAGGAQAGKSPLMPPNPDLADKPEVLGEIIHIVRSFDGN
jgi:uncharacterized membrane protein